MNTIRTAGRLLALCAALLPYAEAQFESATVLGRVTDISGGIVRKGAVSLKNLETGVTAKTETSESGDYQFLNVRVGRYELTAEAPGFRAGVAGPFEVTVNARQRVDLTLQVAGSAQQVDVRDAATILETDSSDRGQVVRRKAIMELPLNGRASADLALLAPGVRKSAIPTRESSFNVHGLRSSFNNFILDGVDNNAYGTGNQGYSNQVIQLSPDAVEEFRVQTSNYSAEFGRAMGAVVNATMRSGGNAMHGAAWEYMRNTRLNAVGFFQPVGGVKPVLVQNQFGVSGGGPIARNRLFYFADYEGFRQVSRQVTYATIATADQREGRFAGPVRNPYTGDLYSNGVIPATAISAFARKVMSDLPPTNIPSASNNLQTMPRGTTQDDKGDARIDYYASSRLTAFGRYSHRLDTLFAPANIPGPSGGNSNGNTRTLNRQVAAGLTWTPGPASLVEARFGFGATEGGKTPIELGKSNMRELYGITGLPETPDVAGGLNTQQISGFATLGRQGTNPQHQDPTTINPKLNYTRIMGRHALKAGYEHQAVATEVEDFHPKYGQDIYDTRFSLPPGARTASYYNLADFLFGARAAYVLNNTAIANYRQRMHFWYLQDDMKLRSNLTLNLGLRYEYATPQWERDLHAANFDPVARKLISATDGSLSERALVNPDRNNFAPRIGLSYSMNRRTVLRSGYGISYVHFNRMGGTNLLAYNGPFVVQAYVSQFTSQKLCTATASPFTCFRPTEMGYPANFTTPANYDPAYATVNYIPRDLRTGYLQSWHFSVQRELARNMLLDVAYVGSHGVKLVVLGDYNQAVPNVAGSTRTVTQRRPITGFDQIQISFNGGFSTYHALQARLEHKYSSGLYLLNAFTWSKAMDNASGHLEAYNGDNSSVNFRNIAVDKGLSGYDQPFNNTTTLIWEVPVGRGRRFLSTMSPSFNAIAGGWRLSAINTMTSGQPINITYDVATTSTVTFILTYRPNRLGDPMLPKSERNTERYFSTAALQVPPATQPLGTAARNIARSYSLYQTDLGLQKDFPVAGERRFQFRAEFFNLLNKTNFQAPNSNLTNASFGTTRSAFPARQVQFALKFIY